MTLTKIVLFDPYPYEGGGAGEMPVSLVARLRELDGMVMPREEAIASIAEAAELCTDPAGPYFRHSVQDHGDYIGVTLFTEPTPEKPFYPDHPDLLTPGPRYRAMRYIEAGN